MSLDQIASRTLATFGGTATVEDLAEHIKAEHPDLYRDTTWAGWCTSVRKAITAPNGGGLPSALSIDDHGTYRQLVLLDVAEYRFGIQRYMRQSRQSRAKAYALAEECRRVHEVWIDPETALDEAAS